MWKRIIQRFTNFSKKKHLVSTYSLERNLLESLLIIKNCDLEPKIIIDVGAHKGTWTAQVQRIFPQATFFLIEPQVLEITSDLNARNVSWHRIGLGPLDQEVTFYHELRDDSSSFKLNNLNRVKDKETKSMKRLDTFISEKNLDLPDLVKLDCEGYDLEVLEGFGDLLGKIPFIFIECAIVNPFFTNDIVKSVNYMNDKNYQLINVSEAVRLGPSLAMWNAELLFVSRDSKFFNIIVNSKIDN